MSPWLDFSHAIVDDMAYEHVHDDLYYRESEVDALIAAAVASVTTVISNSTPVGTVLDYMGTVVPNPLWVILAGQTIVNGQTLYPAWWALIPATMKSGSSIVCPDTRGRVSVGYNFSDATFDTIGEVGGSKDAVVVSHDHDMYSGSNDIVVLAIASVAAGSGADGVGSFFFGTPRTSTNGVSGVDKNLQPYVVFSKMAKVL